MTKMTSPTMDACSSHGKGISGRRRNCRTALIFSILNMLLSFTTAGPVFSKNFQVSHHIQAGRNIRHLPCKIKRSGEEGICMFAIDCLKSNGTHLGTCIDRFYFGSCCQLKDERNVYLNHELDDNRIDGILSGLVPAASSKLPNSNNYNNNHNKTSSNNNGHVTTPQTPSKVTTVFLTDELTRKTTTRRPVSTISSTSSHSSSSSHGSTSSSSSTSHKHGGSAVKPTSSPSSTASHKTTTAASAISTNFEIVSVSSGVLLNDKKPATTSSTSPMNTGTTVFATLSTKLPSTIAVQKDETVSSSNKPTTVRVPLEPAASSSSSSSSDPSSATVQTNKNDVPLDTTSSMEMLEFTTFQSVNSEHTDAVITSPTRRPMTTTTPRRPISVITKKPTTKPPFITSTSPKAPPRRTTTKLPVQEPIFPARIPPVLSHIKSNGTTGRPRPTATTTRRPVQTQADENLIQISSSLPKETTRKPVPNKSTITKQPLLTVTTTTQPPSKRPTKPIIVQKVPVTTTSPADETFTTMIYVESTRAPRPKPTPTADIEVVSSTGLEDPITDEEGTTISPLMKEGDTDEKTSNGPVDGGAGNSSSSSTGGGERRTTTQKPVKITTSVKVETTTSTNTETLSTAALTTSTPVAATTTSSPSPPSSTTTTTTPVPPTSSSTVPPVSSSSSSLPPPTPQTSTTAAPTITSSTQPSTSEGITTDDDEEKEEESTTLAEGIVTWTNVDLIEQEQKNGTTTTEEPLTSQWVPLLTISSDDFKNTSSPTLSNDGTTTPMTPTLTTEGATLFGEDATVIGDGSPSTSSPPPEVSGLGDSETGDEKDDPAITTTMDDLSTVFGNDSTTLSPADESANTTVKPSFPSLEGIDYRMICGKRMFPEPRIVGGAMASFGRWPWQISLRQWRTSTYLHKCGAALLNENWAVTAAHCVDNVPPSDLLLRLGEFDLAEEDEPYGYQERRVQIVASHPQFDPRTFEYDLALLRFYEPVVFQPNIIPVCVPENDENFIGRTAHVTGWGRLYEDGPLPSKLQEVSVPVIENKICETMYRSAGYIEHIPHIFICAGWKKGGYDSCEGDSGGPMVIQRDDKRFQLAGVISWGIGCAEPDQPGVYTRISEFRDWINQILQF